MTEDVFKEAMISELTHSAIVMKYLGVDTTSEAYRGLIQELNSLLAPNYVTDDMITKYWS